MDNNIKIVRLQDGLDLICGCNKQHDSYELTSPMMFQLKGTNLLMQHWLPISLIKDNKTIIREDDILCVAQPSDDFIEYYQNTVEKVTELIKARDAMDDMENVDIDNEQMQQIMDEFQEYSTKGQHIH